MYHKERRPLTVIQGRQADLRQMHRILDLLYYFAIHYQCRRQLSHMTYSYPRKVSRRTITNQKFFLRSSKILSIMIWAWRAYTLWFIGSDTGSVMAFERFTWEVMAILITNIGDHISLSMAQCPFAYCPSDLISCLKSFVSCSQKISPLYLFL